MKNVTRNLKNFSSKTLNNQNELNQKFRNFHLSIHTVLRDKTTLINNKIDINNLLKNFKQNFIKGLLFDHLDSSSNELDLRIFKEIELKQGKSVLISESPIDEETITKHIIGEIEIYLNSLVNQNECATDSKINLKKEFDDMDLLFIEKTSLENKKFQAIDMSILLIKDKRSLRARDI